MYVSQLGFSTPSTRQQVLPTNSRSEAAALVLAPNLLDSTDLFLAHGRHHGQEDVLSFIISTLDLGLQSFITGKLGVILSVATLSQKADKSIFRNVNQLILNTVNMWNVTVVRRRNNILKLLSSENVNSNKVALGMAMLPSLGSGDLNNLAGTVLDDDVAVLADGAGLLRVRLGGAGVGLGLEVVLLGAPI